MLDHQFEKYHYVVPSMIFNSFFSFAFRNNNHKILIKKIKMQRHDIMGKNDTKFLILALVFEKLSMN